MPYACQASPTELSSTDSESENESGAALIIEISDDEDEAEACRAGCEQSLFLLVIA